MKNQIDLYYESVGSGEPLLLISGLNADHSFWIPTLAFLKDKFKVITFDNRGVGQSKNFETRCTTELMAQDVIHLMDKLKIDRGFIVGHSLGGCIAQQIAIHHPERIRKLILCSTQAKLDPLREFFIHTHIELMQSEAPRELIVKNIMAWLFDSHFIRDERNREIFIKFALSKPFAETLESYLYQADALFKHDTTKDLNKITTPTLVISGQSDILVPSVNTRFLAEQIASAKFLTIADVAHMVPVENSEAFCREVIQFFN